MQAGQNKMEAGGGAGVTDPDISLQAGQILLLQGCLQAVAPEVWQQRYGAVQKRACCYLCIAVFRSQQIVSPWRSLLLNERVQYLHSSHSITGGCDQAVIACFVQCTQSCQPVSEQGTGAVQ